MTSVELAVGTRAHVEESYCSLVAGPKFGFEPVTPVSLFSIPALVSVGASPKAHDCFAALLAS